MVKRLLAMQETWVQSLDQEVPLEKEMATHSSTLAWKILWTEEPGRLQSMGSQSQTRQQLHFHFPWWPSDQESACQCRRHSAIPGLGTKIPHAVGLLSPYTTTTEPVL